MRLDLDVLVHNSGNNWGAPFEEYVTPFVPCNLSVAVLTVARLGVVQGTWIEPATPLHNNSETPPPLTKIEITSNYTYWLGIGDWCPRIRDVCLFGLQGWLTSFIAGVGREAGTTGSEG